MMLAAQGLEGGKMPIALAAAIGDGVPFIHLGDERLDWIAGHSTRINN